MKICAGIWKPWPEFGFFLNFHFLITSTFDTFLFIHIDYCHVLLKVQTRAPWCAHLDNVNCVPEYFGSQQIGPSPKASHTHPVGAGDPLCLKYVQFCRGMVSSHLLEWLKRLS